MLHNVVLASEEQTRGVSPRFATSPKHAPGDLLQLGFVAQLCLAAADIDQALQLACRFSPLWSSRHFEYERTQKEVVVRARGLPEACAEHSETLALMLTWIRLAERLSGGAVAPTAVSVPPCCAPRLRPLMHCPVDDSRELSVSFVSEDAVQRNPRCDLTLLRLLLAHGERRLAELQTRQSTGSRARHALARLTERHGSVRVDLLARELGLGVRTLHRRLHAEGTCFRLLVAQHKLEASVSQLRSRATSAKQVALDLGFADPASFHRAFKRWTGQTVSQYRDVSELECGAPSP